MIFVLTDSRHRALYTRRTFRSYTDAMFWAMCNLEAGRYNFDCEALPLPTI